MIPILYKSDEVDFYDNGLGALTEMYGMDVQEQRNGLFTLTASYPVSGKRYKDIEVGRIIMAKPNQNDQPQAFRIVNTELDISGYAMTIEADHITYDLTHNLVGKVHMQGNGQNAMTHLQEATVTPHQFRFISDLEHIGDSTVQYVNPMEAIAGTEGSILQIWGGELKRDNRTVSMLTRRGRDNFTTFRLGKNINGLKYTVDMSNVVTRIVPTATTGDADNPYFILGDTVDSKNLEKYANIYIQHVDMSSDITLADGDTDEQIKAKIDAKAKSWFTQSANSGVDLPAVTVEIDVTSLQDSADYQEKFKNIEALELTDTVTVYVPEFGVNVQAIVNELHFDPIAERITSIVVGTVKQSFADANANSFRDLQNRLTQIKQDSITAVVSANGKNTNYYGANEPKHPIDGDLWYKQVGDETYLMIFKDGHWVELVSTRTQEIIADAVDKATSEAKAYADELNDTQASEVADFKAKIQEGMDSASAEREQLSQKADDMLKQANDHADDLYGEAVATAKEEGQNAIKTAGSEAQALVTSATATAHAEAQAVAQSADDALTKAKADLGDDIQKNHADIVATQTELSSKVSQSAYDEKTKDLDTKYTQVKQTADGVTTDVANYKLANDKKVSANTAQLKVVADEIDSKVSSVDFDKKTGDMQTSINTISQKADSFELEISKINDKVNTEGQVNQLFNTEFTPDFSSWDMSETWADTLKPYRSIIYDGSNTVGLNTQANTDKTYTTMKQLIPFTLSGSNKVVSVSWQSIVYQVNQYSTVHVRSYDANMTRLTDVNVGNWGQKALKTWGVGKFENISIPDNASFVEVLWSAREGFLGYMEKPMLVFDDHVGAYVPGAYNNNDKVTANTLAIKATSDELATKVAKSDYDKNNQTLNNSISTVSQKADSYNVKLTQYQQSNDGKVNANTQQISAMNGQINSKVSQTAYDADKTSFNTQMSNVNQKADGIKASVTDLSAQVNAMGQVNQLINTEFNPDLEGWTAKSNDGKHNPYRSYLDKNVKATTVGFYTINADTSKGNYFAQFRQTVQLGTSSNGYISLSWQSYLPEMADGMYGHLWVIFHDKDGNVVYNSAGANKMGNWITAGQSAWTRQKMEKVEVPNTAVSVDVSFEAREGIRAYLVRPMLVFDDHIGSYVPGTYNNDGRVAELEVNVDGITGLVNDPKTGLKATATLASNGLSVATSAQSDASSAIQTAKGLQTQVTSNDGDIKNLQSTTSQTASQVTTEIKDRKNGDDNTLTQAKNFTTSQISSAKSGLESEISQSADGIMASVTMQNKLFNTSFSPDLDGWNVTNNGANGKNYNFYRSYVVNGETTVGVNVPTDAGDDTTKWYSYFEQDVAVPGNNGSTVFSLTWDVRTVTNTNYTSLWFIFKDANHNTIDSSLNVLKYWNGTDDGTWYTKTVENIAVPTNAKYIRVSFQCREGTTAYLKRPMLTFTSKAQDYMPGSYSGMNTSTVLELFKDNWALGIADNTGKLISGINGDKSGTVIQGKKLVINSDTTITGKAFIDGSVIKNASISQAQMGNASIGTAQIINVDVSKISGNIANFITANIKTLNAKVLYGDTGHLGTTDTGRVINKQDNHLQLASKGFYDSTNDRAQLELLNNSDSSISDEMKGSFNYYGNPTDKGHGLGIRMKYNQILAIDEDGGSKNLYLSPYAGGQVRIVSRDMKSYYDICASNFKVSSQRKFKSNITDLDDGALDIVNNTKIHKYTKNGTTEIGVITDETDDRLLSDDGKFVSIYDYTSVLYKAVQELSAEVKELKNKNAQ